MDLFILLKKIVRVNNMNTSQPNDWLNHTLVTF